MAEWCGKYHVEILAYCLMPIGGWKVFLLLSSEEDIDIFRKHK